MKLSKKEILIIFVLAILIAIFLMIYNKAYLLSGHYWAGFLIFYTPIVFLGLLLFWIIIKNIRKSPEIISFWLFSYGILLLIWLRAAGFRLSEGEILPIFTSTLIVFYSPLYLLPFFSIRRLKERKYALYIRPIIYSFLLFIPHIILFTFSQCVSGFFDPAPVRCGIVGPIKIWPLIVQIIACLTLSSIYYFKKESILPRLLKISLVFLVIVGIYLFVFYVRASHMPEAAESLTKKAVEAKNVYLCEEIKKEGKKRGAISWKNYRECIEAVAIELNDESICSHILENRRENLIEIYLDKGWSHSSTAYASGEIESEVGYCGQIFFAATSNLCGDISNKEERMECIKEIAVENNDIELCKKLEVDPYGYDCITSLVLKNNNPALCYGEESNGKLTYYPDEVFPGWFFGECFERLFLKTNDSTICEKASLQGFSLNESVKAYCYRAAALKLDDIQLCEKISSTWESMTRRDCFEQFK